MEENINLLDVTLCAVDCVEPQLALESLIISSEKINFGNILLFSDIMPVSIPARVTFIKIPKISNLIEYSNFIINQLGQFIETSFCLTVHADGWIHNPHLWKDSYKDWDYIGAPWPLHLHFVNKDLRVGNGGVSFRSKRLLDETSKIPQINTHEDVFICQYLKNSLLEKDIKIAPLEVAKTFSLELECDDCPVNPQTECLAFHGKTCTPFHIKQNSFLKQRMEDRLRNISIIEQKYYKNCNTPSDINEHLPILLEYAKKCETIAEMGVRYVVSSYALALSKPKKLLCLDIHRNNNIETFIDECKNAAIDMEFVHSSSLEYKLPHEFDMLFIDTLHTFDQLSKELELHHSKIKKYIIFHDTVFWGHKNEDPVDSSDTGERGDNVGLVPAIRNFLKDHEEWKEVCTYTNNNGLTILQRLPYSRS